jgi:predicted Zn-dependent protease
MLLRPLLETALRLSTAGETEVALTVTTEALTRFAHNAIHQNVVETDAELEVRAAFGKRVGRATTNDLTPLGLERVVATACELAQHLPENPEWPGLTDPAEVISPTPPAAYDPEAAEMSPARRAQAVAEICRAARAAGRLASGALGATTHETALLNTRGLWAYAPGTQADFMLVVESPDDGPSAYAEATGWRWAQINTEALTQEALTRSATKSAPRPIPSGDYAVVLDPYAVVVLLEALAGAGLGALAVQEERSWMNHHFGQPLLAPALTIVDDASDPAGVPQAFDCEGMPKQRVTLVADGVPRSAVYDRWTASREAGRRSTGHAQPWADEDWDGPLPENLILTPGRDTVEDLICKTERGLYITRFWYVNVTTPHDCGLTGTTRDGVWMIERGELAYPVPNLRFDQALVPALRGITGLGRDLRTLAGFFGGVHRVPAMALESFRFIE